MQRLTHLGCALALAVAAAHATATNLNERIDTQPNAMCLRLCLPRLLPVAAE